VGMPAVKQGAMSRGAGRANPRLRLVPPTPKRPPQAASAHVEAACRSAFRLAVAAFVLAAAFGLVRVSLSARVSEAAIDAAKLEQRIKAESVVSDRLELDKSLLVTPSRIESVAAGSMQMTKASKVFYIAIPDAVAKPGGSDRAIAEAGTFAQAGASVAGIVRAAVAVTEKEARDLLVGDVGLAVSE
jgi:cell division protein FtsL